MLKKNLFIIAGLVLGVLILAAGIGIARAEDNCIYGCNPTKSGTSLVHENETVQLNFGSLTPLKTVRDCSLSTKTDSDTGLITVFTTGFGCGFEIEIKVCFAAPEGTLAIKMTEDSGSSKVYPGVREGKLVCSIVKMPTRGVSFGLAR